LNRLAAAVLFLTRIPLPGKRNIGADEVGRSIVFFPLVGAAIGGCQWLVLQAMLRFSGMIGRYQGDAHVLPAQVLSIFVIAVGVAITGALHLDGVADMADGFGGGRTREDVLRIMRDHAVGTFGAVALILVLGLKFSSISFLMERPGGAKYLVLAPAMARWTIAVLAFSLPYARSAGSGLGAAVARVTRMELLLATVITGGIAAAIASWAAIFFLLVSMAATALNGWLCMRRIQGVTGDTLGSNTEICEALLLAAGCFLTGHK